MGDTGRVTSWMRSRRHGSHRGRSALLGVLLGFATAAFLAPGAMAATTYPYSATTATQWPWVANNAVSFTNGAATVALPFSFTIYGTSYSSVTIASNGTLQFGSSYTGGVDSCLQSGHFTAPTIMPLWSSFSMSGTGEGAWYDTFNNPDYGNVFVVKWAGHVSGIYPATTSSFEVVLVKNTNEILLSYDNAVPSAYIAASTIGIEAGGSGGAYSQYSCYSSTQRQIAADTTITYTPAVPAIVDDDHAVTSGNPDVGQTLSVSTGTWSPNPDSYSYRWERCTSLDINSCSFVTGWSSSNQYTVQSADYGDYLVAVVQPSNGWGPSVYADLAYPFGPIDYVYNLTAPSFSFTGSAVVGSMLTASSNGTWRPTPTGYHYMWIRCSNTCSPIAGATSSSYTVTTADIGNSVYLEVQAYDTYGSSSWAVSPNGTGVIPGPPSNTQTPAVSGLAQVGATLSTTNGSWTNAATSYQYEWLRGLNGNFYVIANQAASTYTVTSADVGYTIFSAVRAHNSAGWSSNWYGSNNGIGPIPAPPPANSTAPHVSGSAQAGATLGTSTGTWTNSPDQYAYQWFRCAGASPCTTISGATNQSYTAASADVGDTLTVQVRAHNAGGWSGWVPADNSIGPIAAGTTTSTSTSTAISPSSSSSAGGSSSGGTSSSTTTTTTTSTSGAGTGGVQGAGGTAAALRVVALRIAPASFHAARRGGSVAAATGASVSFQLSRNGYVTFMVKRGVAGRLVGRRCVARTRKNASAKRCVRFVAVRGSFRVPAVGRALVARGHFTFTGRLSGAALAPGRYQLVAVAHDSAGASSQPVTAKFAITG